MKNIFKLLLCMLVCQFTGVIGSVFTIQAVSTWYLAMNEPFFNPPGWVFAPVWITLYCLMGFSVFLVWKNGIDYKVVKGALLIFVLQLVLNSSWTVVFFGLRSIKGALFIIILMWLCTLWSILRFGKLSKLAAILLVPYMIWVSFALLLNASRIFLNG